MKPQKRLKKSSFKRHTMFGNFWAISREKQKTNLSSFCGGTGGIQPPALTLQHENWEACFSCVERQKRLKKLRLRRHRFTVISRGATMKTSFDTANKSISLCNVKFSRHVEPDKTCKKKSQEAVPKMTFGEFGDHFRSRILLWNVRICLSIIK